MKANLNPSFWWSLLVFWLFWGHGQATLLASNTFTYASQPFDTTTKTIQLGGYRAYRPAQTRFLSHDSQSPFVHASTQNGYNYAAGNPMLLADPSGHNAQLAWTLLSMGLGLAAGLTGIYGARTMATYYNWDERISSTVSGAASSALSTFVGNSINASQHHRSALSADGIKMIGEQMLMGGFFGHLSSSFTTRSYLKMAAYNALTNGASTAAFSDHKGAAQTPWLTIGMSIIIGAGLGTAEVYFSQPIIKPSNIGLSAAEEGIELASSKSPI